MAKRADLAERIAELKARKDQLTTKLVRLETEAKGRDRKLDARRKIIVGGAIISVMEQNPNSRAAFAEMLSLVVTRPRDREAIADLLGGAKAAPMNPTRPAEPVRRLSTGDGSPPQRR